jgi:hypothetical protein
MALLLSDQTLQCLVAPIPWPKRLGQKPREYAFRYAVLRPVARMRTIQSLANSASKVPSEEAFVASMRSEVTGSDPELREHHERAAPLWHSNAGQRRDWGKRSANGGNP